MAYAAPSDLIKRLDVRRIGKLLSDTGTPVSPSSIPTDPNLLAILDDASGMVDSALLRGGRYQPTDLAALTGTGQALLTRLTCDIASGLLVMRRGFSDGEVQAQAGGYAAAMKLLDDLADGKNVLNIQTAIAAGLPIRVQIDANKTLITAAARRSFGSLITDVTEPQPKQPGGGL